VAKPGKEAANREGEATLVSYWSMAVGGAAIVLVVAVALTVTAWIQRDEAHGRRQLEACAARVVRELGDQAAALRQRLRAWAADPQLQQALRSGHADGLHAREEELARQIPGALRARLLEPGYRGAGESGSQALSYAGLDLIRQAERQRGVTPLEVHRLGEPEVHLALAGPVLDEQGDGVLGVVHVALPLSMLPATRSGADDLGRILFQQQAGADAVTVDPESGGVTPEGEPDLAIEVPGTRLRVAAWATGDAWFASGILWYALGAYVALLAALAAVLSIPLRRLKQALALDYAGVLAVVEDAASRRPIRRVRCRLAETRPVIEMIAHLLRDPLAPRAGPPRPGLRQDTASDAAPPDRPPPVSARRLHREKDLGEAPPAPFSKPWGVEVEPLDLGDIDLGAYPPAGAKEAAPSPLAHVPSQVFRAYDIRGIAGKDLSTDLARHLGLAVGSALDEDGRRKVIVGRDTRPTGESLCAALVDGLRRSGCDVIDLGVAPTPLLYFATRYQGDSSGVMVTGSHNPPEYNGMKVVIDGEALAGERIASLRERIERGAYRSGYGGYEVTDLAWIYVDHVEKDVAIARSMKLVVDCGNGAASLLAPRLYRALDCEVVELNCDPEAGFPDGRVPDPSRPECLEALQKRVLEEEAALGLAFDGDGDRLGVVDSSGKIIWTDRVLMLLAADVLSRHPGTDVVFDVKCSHHLGDEILRHGGRPVMWRSGHSPLKAKLRETGGLLAGEWSGHIIFRERWYGVDDALYAGARLIEVLALDPRPSAEVFAALPEAIGTPELVLPVEEGESARIMRSVLELADEVEGMEAFRIDGLRLETTQGWGLVRASNTHPALTFRFEADDEATLEEIKGLFRGLIIRAAGVRELPF
jgi:phosphomannomutase/phosphoglucomutase